MKINLKAIGSVAVLTLSTNFLGFVRDIFFAKTYGISSQADAYVTAFSIVSSFFLIFTAGTVQSSFMPRYQCLLDTAPDKAAQLARSSLIILSLTLAGLFFGVLIFSSALVHAIVPGFDAKKLTVTIQLVHLLSPAIFFMGIGAIYQSILHAQKKFFIPAFIPLLSNVLLIIFLIFFSNRCSINGMAYAALCGSIFWLLLGFPATRSSFYHAPKKLLTASQKKVLGYTLPLIILLVSDQLSSLIQKYLISGLGDGYIAGLNYAYRISGLPIGIFSMAIAVVVFPNLIEAISSNNQQEAERYCYDGFELVLFFSIPVMCVYFFCGKELIQLVFQRGSFDEHATMITYQGLSWYAAGIIPQSLLVIYARIYYAAQDYYTPMKIGVFSALLHILTCAACVHFLGYQGVAISTSLYAYLYCYLLHKRCNQILPLSFSRLARCIPRPLISAIPMALILATSPGFAQPTKLFSTLALSSLAFISVYYLLHPVFSEKR